MTDTVQALAVYCALATALAVALPRTAAADVDPAVPTYSAAYEVFYNGRVRGTSQISVDYVESENGYRFESITRLRGILLRLAAPKPIVERSLFRSLDGHITSLHYRYEDGSRSGDDSFELQFDWSDNLFVRSRGDRRDVVDATPGTLDPGAAQVQLMLDARSGGDIEDRLIADDSAPLAYRYTNGETVDVSTAYGSFRTEQRIQQRTGSSRQTLFWLAPDLDYLPVRIEQRRNGKTRLVFVLKTLEWLNTPGE